MTGDREVILFWIPNAETDLAGYRIYRSTRPTGYFPCVATVGWSASEFVDRGLRNGVTYYYAISALDESDNESELSPGTVSDTPRPEGEGLELANSEIQAVRSGYDFSNERVLDYRDLEADIYFWSTADTGPWMIATERSQQSYTDIQDVGFVPLDEVDWAPGDGWAPRGEVPLIRGHSYVVWIWDDHYAKFRVLSLTPEQVVLQWAYQLDPGNLQLALPSATHGHAARTGNGDRVHTRGMERRIPS